MLRGGGFFFWFDALSLTRLVRLISTRSSGDMRTPDGRKVVGIRKIDLDGQGERGEVVNVACFYLLTSREPYYTAFSVLSAQGMSNIFDDATRSGEGKRLYVKGFERNKLFKERVMELKDRPEKRIRICIATSPVDLLHMPKAKAEVATVPPPTSSTLSLMPSPAVVVKVPTMIGSTAAAAAVKLDTVTSAHREQQEDLEQQQQQQLRIAQEQDRLLKEDAEMKRRDLQRQREQERQRERERDGERERKRQQQRLGRDEAAERQKDAEIFSLRERLKEEERRRVRAELKAGTEEKLRVEAERKLTEMEDEAIFLREVIAKGLLEKNKGQG